MIRIFNYFSPSNAIFPPSDLADMNRFLPVCWFAFVFAVFPGFSQNPQTARLKAELAAAKTDTSRVLLMAEISSSYRYSKPDSSLAYAQRGLTLARKIRFSRGEGRCLTRLSHNVADRGNLPAAFRQCLMAQHLNESSSDWLGLAQTLNVLGIIYYTLENHTQARDCWLRGVTVYNQKKLGADADLATLIGNLGASYRSQNRLDSAFHFIQCAYRIANHSAAVQRSPRGNPLPFILRELGLLQVSLGRSEQALVYYRRAIRLCQAENDLRNAARTFQFIAEAHLRVHRPDSSAVYARKALVTAQALPLMVGVLQSSNVLSEWFKTQNQPDSALKYLEIAVAARDSLFNQRRIQELQEINFDEQRRARRAEAERERLESRVKIYALLAGVLVLLAGAFFLWRTNRRQQRANALLHEQKREIEQQRATAEYALAELKTTQAQLIQSEKMASLGELTAGIAHEIQNPLNFVNNFAEVSVELVHEIREEREKPAGRDEGLVDELLADLGQNLQKITQHGQRASGIVRGMLDHARASTSERQPTDLNALADEALRLSYHGLKAKNKSFNANLVTDFVENPPAADVVPQDLSRVFLNLFNNAFYAVQEKKKAVGEAFRPEVRVSTRLVGNAVEIRVRDNGNGIPAAVRDKIFQPFFTTKPTGEGTGLGLSLSYDIVTKGHGGTLTVETAEGEFTEFVVKLPFAGRLATAPQPG